MSVVVATALEWVTGFLLEKLFHHRWWDYSDMPMNIQGYVCVPFSIAWGAACVFVVKLVHPAIFKMINWIPPLVGHILLGILLAVMAVDLCVTVNEILKLNRELKKMQEITEELQRLSVYLGENISKNVLLSMEKQEYVKEKVDDVKERVEEKADDLKELVEGKGFNVVRTWDRDFLLDIRNHKYEYEEIMTYVENLFEEVNSKIATCSLPDTVDKEKVNELLIKARQLS